MKSSKKKMFIAILVSAFLISSAYALLFPCVHAAEPTILEKSTSILNTIVALDLNAYIVTAKDYPQNSYFDVVPEENVRFTLKSNTSKLDVYCTFANGKLHILHVLEAEGSPSMTRTFNGVLDMAKSFLDEYAVYSGNTLYTDLSSTLNAVDAGKNSTMTSGNMKLQVTAIADYTTFSWTYTVNGVGGGDKCVALGYKDGFLKYFVDTWDIYSVGSTAVNVSEEEAVAIAVERAKSFSWKVVSGNDTFEVKDFNVTRAMTTQLVFCSSMGADASRSDYLLTLYPMWRIGVGLDKWYPGDVYGIYVDVWADTGEVRHVQEVFSTLPPELVGDGLFDESTAEALANQATVDNVASNSVSILWVAFSAVAVIVFGFVPVWLVRKKGLPRFRGFPKLRFYKITVGLLCFLLFSMLLLGSILTVKAASMWHATIWGSTSDEPSHTVTEKNYQTWIAGNITSFFNAADYSAGNYQGNSTLKNTFLLKIGDSAETCWKAAVVYFDHGIGANKSYPPNYEPEWHYSFYDSSGTRIYDDEIYLETEGKTFFALINTCLSAKIDTGYIGEGFIGYPTPQGMSPTGHAVGMPFAFTHRTVMNSSYPGFDTAYNMSIDGYAEPDGGDFCFIGFPLGSASLSQTVDPEHPSVIYGMWVWEFFEYALYHGVSVNSALDYVSLYLFGDTFATAKLRTGFTAIWPPSLYWENCTMAVYGNGNLHLHPSGQMDIAAATNINGNWLSADVDVGIDGQYVGSTLYSHLHGPLEPGNHTIEVPLWDSGIPSCALTATHTNRTR